jgi:rSAM/selenodomain-associated transferase 1
MPPVNASPVSIAVLAKAPVPGFANTRLIPAIGAHAAAALQERLTERAVATAIEANVGPVTLWGAPDASHDTFLKMVVHRPIALRPQPAGDLGARMLAATAAGPGLVLVIGTDCPALTALHLRGAARALRDEGADVVLIPAEDGGYVLIGTRVPQPQIFSGIAWSTPRVLAETRARVIALRLRLAELPPLWDVDTEADLARMEREHPELAL